MNNIILNILAMAVLSLVLIIGLNASMKYITNHDQKLSVPNITGESLNDAIRILKEHEMGYILVDSMFEFKLKPHEVIDQSPKPGEFVKEKRKIYLTINSLNPPSVILPNLVDMSKRQASLILESSGFKLGREIYQPDIAKDAVLQVRVDGKPIGADKLLPKGTIVDLVLGDGFGTLDIEIPDLVGLTIIEAMAVLDAVNLSIGKIVNGKGGDIDDLDAYVYYQEPGFSSGVKMSPGDPVNLYVSDGVPQNLLN
ncbi:MAG TPA: PASTA domain-containing protein [Chitinophagales bacterium]|nr:PASTA domain-containing protein [Chitinophagales bacterium]